jgi:hypothetical protein
MDEEKVTVLSAERDAYLRQLRNELLRQRDEAIGERNELFRQRDVAIGEQRNLTPTRRMDRNLQRA